MYLDFEKWHGCQNDFVVLRVSDEDGDVVLDSIKRQAGDVCQRRTGIGADGLLILRTRKRTDEIPWGLRIINSDGSIALNCGNGLRCAAGSIIRGISERQSDTPEILELDVEGDAKLIRILAATQDKVFSSVEMGIPATGKAVPWGAAVLAETAAIWQRVFPGEKVPEMIVSDIGNPHLVIRVDQGSRDRIIRIGPALQTVGGLDGINVHLVAPAATGSEDRRRSRHETGQDLDDVVTAWVWERGAGETPACGSGACAIAAVIAEEGLSDRSLWTAVDMPGGRLYARHESPGLPALLAGPAEFVYSGTISI